MRLLETGILKVALFVLCVCPIGGGVTSRPASTQPTIPGPDRQAEAFLKAMEKSLVLERRDRQESDRALWEASRFISDEPLAMSVAMTGLRLGDLSEEKANLARKELAGVWGSIINFYAGHIDYSKIKVADFPGTVKSSSSPMIHVLFPAVNPALPRPVNILVTMVQENNAWKVKSLTLLPGQLKAPQTKPS